jgi:DNA-binding HxlR family transcriptional regulator
MPTDCTIVDGGSPTCYCPLSGVIELLGRKYTMQIVCVVGAHEPVRFGVIEDHVPTASTSTLSARLEALVDAGLFERAQHDEIPPRVEYSLTDDGRELRDRLEPLLAWAAGRE